MSPNIDIVFRKRRSATASGLLVSAPFTSPKGTVLRVTQVSRSRWLIGPIKKGTFGPIIVIGTGPTFPVPPDDTGFPPKSVKLSWGSVIDRLIELAEGGEKLFDGIGGGGGCKKKTTQTVTFDKEGKVSGIKVEVTCE